MYWSLLGQQLQNQDAEAKTVEKVEAEVSYIEHNDIETYIFSDLANVRSRTHACTHFEFIQRFK